MTFQKVVNRSYTLGFPGDIVRDGPKRAKSGRIQSAAGNAFSRAFTFVDENGGIQGGNASGPLSSGVADVFDVTVGGAGAFFGILGNRLEHTNYGDAAGALDPSLVLPQYSEGSFFDMVTGMVAELFNATAASATPAYGMNLYYNAGVVNSTVAGVPPGGIVAGAAAPADNSVTWTQIPNAKLAGGTGPSLAAGGPTAPVSGLFIIQVTE